MFRKITTDDRRGKIASGEAAPQQQQQQACRTRNASRGNKPTA